MNFGLVALVDCVNFHCVVMNSFGYLSILLHVYILTRGNGSLVQRGEEEVYILGLFKFAPIPLLFCSDILGLYAHKSPNNCQQ